MDDKPLYVPNNFPIRKEFWQGFGRPEAIVTASSSLALIIISLYLYFSVGISDIKALLLVIVGTSIVITLVQKLEMGLSIIDFYKIKLRYHNEQQKFMYRYLEENNDVSKES